MVVPAFVACIFLMAGCGPTGPQWQTLATEQSNTIISLAQDPTQPKIMYAGANHGIVYRARTDVDGTPIGGKGIAGSAQTNAVLPDPHTAGLVYAATTNGFYVTTDFGDQWSARGAGLPANDVLTSLIFGSGGVLFVGTAQHGVYESADQGRTWHQASAGMTAGANIYTLFRDPATQTLFAGLDGGGLYASTDNGENWAQRTGGLSATAHVYALAETPSKGLNATGPTLYAGTDAGLYASIDGGQTWTRHGAGAGLPSGGVVALAADPKRPGALWAGIGSNVFGTTDGGRHWSVIAQGITHTVTSLLAVVQPNGTTAVFTAAGQLQRYPAAPGGVSSLFGDILTWSFVIILFLLGFFVLRRTRKRLIGGGRATQTDSTRASDGATSGSATASSPQSPNSSANGHLPQRSSQHATPSAFPPNPGPGGASDPRSRDGEGKQKR